MQPEPTSKSSLARRLTARDAWIGPASGFVCSALVTLIGRSAEFEYRREASMAVFFVVAVLVGGFYSGRLKSQPAGVVALAFFAAVVSVAMVRW